LWAQVEARTHHNRQGFRLTADEQAELAKRNTGHEKPLKGEMEVLDIIDMAENNPKDYTFVEMTVTEFKVSHEALKNYSVEQLAKALDKIGRKSLGRKIVDGKQQRVRSLPKRNVTIYKDSKTEQDRGYSDNRLPLKRA